MKTRTNTWFQAFSRQHLNFEIQIFPKRNYFKSAAFKYFIHIQNTNTERKYLLFFQFSILIHGLTFELEVHWKTRIRTIFGINFFFSFNSKFYNFVLKYYIIFLWNVAILFFKKGIPTIDILLTWGFQKSSNEASYTLTSISLSAWFQDPILNSQAWVPKGKLS